VSPDAPLNSSFADGLRRQASIGATITPGPRKVSGMLGLFSNKRVLIAFAILTAVLAIALLVIFNII
jgi:hypothetical protein